MAEEVSTTHLVGSGMRYWFVQADAGATTPAVPVEASALELHIGLVAVAFVQLFAAAVVIVGLNYPHVIPHMFPIFTKFLQHQNHLLMLQKWVGSCSLQWHCKLCSHVV